MATYEQTKNNWYGSGSTSETGVDTPAHLINSYLNSRGMDTSQQASSFLQKYGLYDKNSSVAQSLAALNSNSQLFNQILSDIGQDKNTLKSSLQGTYSAPSSGVTAQMRRDDPAAAAAQYAKIDPQGTIYPAMGQTKGDLFTNPSTGVTYNWRTGAIVNDPKGIGASLLPKAQAPTTASAVNTVGGVNMPTVNSGVGNISNAVAGSSGVSSFIDTQQKIADDRAKQIEADQKALQSSTKPLLDRLLSSKSPSEARADAQDETGINPANYFAEQKQKIAEIDSLTQEYNATKAAMEAQIAATGDKLASNNFINNQVAQIQRNAAPKLNMMSANINSKAATLEALQGNFNAAQDFVNQAVQDATAEYKYNYDVYTTFYEMNRDIMDSLDEPYKQAYEASLDLAKVQYEQAVDEANAVGELMMDNPKAGITMTDSFAVAAQKVARSGGSLNYQQEQRLGGGGSGGGFLGFGDVLQGAVNEGASPEEAARAAAVVSEQMGIPVNQTQLNTWVNDARKLKATTSTPAQTTQTTGVPKTAYQVGQSITSSPYYQAFNPSNLATGTKNVASTVGNFFSGLFGL